MHCWGENDFGQSSPPAGRFLQISVGHRHSCAVGNDWQPVCWGANLLHGADLGDGLDRGRLAVRLTDSGAIQMGFQPQGRALILPSAGLFPPDATVGSWYRSSTLVGRWSKQWGTIRSRLGADGRIELMLVTTDGEQVVPALRFLPSELGQQWTYSDDVEVRE